MTTTSTVQHEGFCLPRPGLDAPRLETYTQPVYQDDGITPTRYVRVERCIECGAATYDGARA